MSDLRERLLAQARLMQSRQMTPWRIDMALMFEAEARIAELEAKLAKAALHLAELLQVQDGLPMTGMDATRRADQARATLAELKNDHSTS